MNNNKNKISKIKIEFNKFKEKMENLQQKAILLRKKSEEKEAKKLKDKIKSF